MTELAIEQIAPAKITLGMGLRPFWSVAWRGWLLVIAAFVANVVTQIGLKLGGYEPVQPHSWYAVLLALAGFLQGMVFIVVINSIVFQKSYRDFRLVPRDTQTNEPISLSYGNGFKIWWSLAWRQFLMLVTICVGCGLLVGVVLTLAAAFLHLGKVAILVLMVLSYLASLIAIIVVSLKIFTIVMVKRYSDFYLTVVPNAPLPTTQGE